MRVNQDGSSRTTVSRVASWMGHKDVAATPSASTSMEISSAAAGNTADNAGDTDDDGIDIFEDEDEEYDPFLAPLRQQQQQQQQRQPQQPQGIWTYTEIKKYALMRRIVWIVRIISHGGHYTSLTEIPA
ncbi:hypothetical protein BJV82DRAFT_581691 [Fennellomyces sp. T-0311]|nr:hypothetical protein BJV82DRAFT_581691 [Fennellomyces sp. T-0311]